MYQNLNWWGKFLWQLGIYPNDPKNTETIFFYVIIMLIGVGLFAFFGFIGPKSFKLRMRKIVTWMSINLEIIPFNIYKPINNPVELVTGNVTSVPPVTRRLKNWFIVRLVIFIITFTAIIFWLTLASR